VACTWLDLISGVDSQISKEAGVDVLLFGTLNSRREEIGRLLRNKGLNVVFKRFTSLEEQESYICSAKVVVNVHYYPEASLEVHRVNPLLARGKCVVSEMGSDPELDDMYKSAVVFASYQDLVSCIMSLLAEGALFFSVSAFPLTQAVSYTCAVQNFL